LGLINKKVYSDNADYIGKISDVILGKNRIDRLRIEIDKKHKFDKKGVIISYKQVKSVGEIVVINEKVLEKLKIIKS
jgi:sporulation protein YlmC with PRC-barrel domain